MTNRMNNQAGAAANNGAATGKRLSLFGPRAGEWLNGHRGPAATRLRRLLLPPGGNGAAAGGRWPSACVEEAGAAVLAATGRDAPRLAVRFRQRDVELDLRVGDSPLIGGPWTVAVWRDGRPLPAAADWRMSCWHADADADYLELRLDLAEGVSVQRHIALARQDRLLWLADAVIGLRRGRLQYDGRLAVDPGVRVEVKAGGGGRLLSHRLAAALLPLAIAGSKAEGATLRGLGGGLQYFAAAEGAALFAPLVLDLDRRRTCRRSPAERPTWQRLTVAQDRRAVEDDVAVGYRLRIARRQWLFYRSLAPEANRTVLGHNLAIETLFGRFTSKGEVEPLVQIEGAES